ncbi:MAG: hypothetical protein WC758_07660 [Candidatus Woesearchaeota archaeon]|jgi:hypothetical protein
MKNKKVNFRKTVLISMLIFLIGLPLLYGFFLLAGEFITYKPTFTIIENECHNETIFVPEDSKLIIYSDSVFHFEKVLNVSNEMAKVKYKFERKVCEQKEIKQKSLKEAWNICWNDKISKEDFVLCSLMEEGKLDFGSAENDIDWLDENCEVARCTTCEDLYCKNQKCDLYYCEDYEVEVKR